MANLKSKIPVANYADDMKLLNVGRPKQSSIRRSVTTHSRKRNTVGSLNDIYKPGERFKYAKQVDDNSSVKIGNVTNRFKYNSNTDNDVKDINEDTKEVEIFRNGNITRRNSKANAIKRTKNYKISYDPDREPGNEYVIEKGSVFGLDKSYLEENTQRQDTPFSVNVIPRIVQSAQPSNSQLLVAQRDSVTPVTAAKSISETPLSKSRRSSPIWSQKNGADDQNNHLLTIKTPDTLFTSTPRETTKNTLSDTYNLDKSATLESYDSSKGKSPKPFTSIESEASKIKSYDQLDSLSRLGQLSSAGSLRPDRAENISNSLFSKESTNTSLPPQNFKTSLFKRVRHISTPRRTPLFNPVHLLENTHSDIRPTSVNVRENRDADHVTPSLGSPVSAKTEPKTTQAGDRIFTEDTFIKEKRRFERVASSESVRSHYDKGKTRGEFFSGSSSAKKRTTTNDMSDNTRFEIVDLEANKDKPNTAKEQHRPPTSISTGTFRIDTQNSTQVETTPINLPARNNSANTHTGADVHATGVKRTKKLDASQESNNGNFKADLVSLSKKRVKPKLSDKSFGLLTDNNYGKLQRTDHKNSRAETEMDASRYIFSETKNKTRLKLPQYITADLKLVKRKVKKEIIAQKIHKTENTSIHRKAILNNFNKNRKQVRKDTTQPVNEMKLSSKQNLVPKRKPVVPKLNKATHNRTLKEINQADKWQTMLTKKNVIKPSSSNPEPKQAWTQQENTHKIDKRRDSKTIILNDNTWRIQPKIHRLSQPKDRKPFAIRKQSKHSVASSETNSTISTNDWVTYPLGNGHTNEKNTNRVKKFPTVSNSNVKPRKSLVIQRLCQPKLTVKLHRSTNMKPKNLVNLGIFMPLEGKGIKRKAKHRNHVYTQVGKVKGYESEIPILYSEEEDGFYHEARPFTDSDQLRYPHHRRYEGDNDHFRINFRDPAHRKIGKTTGALVLFLRNGDKNFKGLRLAVNNRFKNFETLLVFLNEQIPTPTGVHYIFKWPEGKEVTSVTEFRNRCVYLVSSTREIKRDCNYGESRETFWCNKKPSAGKMRRNELGLYQKPPSPKEPPRQSPLIVTIINNRSRDKREKVILNPQTQQSFEEWVNDINCHDLPVRTLHTEKPPHSQIKSFSHLFRELRIRSNFIACGDEMLPLELKNMELKKRQAPSSNSSTESISESRTRKKKLPRQQDMGQIYENGRPDSPSSTAMSTRYDYGPRYPGSYPGPYPATRGQPLGSRRDYRDSVEIEIDGTIREFIPPSFADPRDDGCKPDKKLKCNWVYGFRGRDARHNLMVLPKTGELVYYVSAVVVLYTRDGDQQRHYSQHNEEITCMMMHPNQYLIATGQMHGTEPDHASHIRIWHSVTLSTYCVIGLGVFSGGIVSIGFSAEVIKTREDEKREAEGRKERKLISPGRYMCVLDGSEKHVLSVWDWQADSNQTDSGRIIARTTTSTDAVHCACFYPDGANNSILITYGAKHIYFWKIFYDAARKKEAKILRDRNSGIFEDDIPKSMNCLTFLPCGDVVTGDSSGNLMIWDRDMADAFTCKLVIQAHESGISSLCLLEDGTLLSGGGNEIKAWNTNSDFKTIKTRQIPQEAGCVRSIVTQTPGGIDGRLYIGTTNSAILDGSLQLKFRYLCQGHSEGVWGVVPHPYEPTFISAGYDQVVYKWSLITHKVIWRSQIEAPCTSVAVDHRHELVALGTAEGVFVVLNAYNGMHITTVQVGTEPIGCLSFSPDGTSLAMGCNDGLISVFDIRERGQTYRRFNMALRGHNAGVAHLDWSSDGRCIQSVAHDHELLFWDVDSMQQIKITRMMRDVDWFTNTCHVSYNLIGPWSNIERGEFIKVVNRSSYRDLIVTGDTKGRIRLYKNPCSKEKAEYRGTRIYSSDVTAVAFTPDNKNILSCGGNDAALVQWNVVDE